MAFISKIIVHMEHSKSLSSIKKGFVVMIPLLITGAIALLLRSFPLPAFQEFLSQAWNGQLLHTLNFIYNSTLGLLSLFLTLSISYHYADAIRSKHSPLKVFAMLVSCACFALSFADKEGNLQLDFFGPLGVFMAILCAIIATNLFYRLYALFQKMSYYYVTGNEEDLKNAVSAIFPMTACIILFTLGNILIRNLFQVENVNALFAKAFGLLFSGSQGELSEGLLFVFLLNLLWLFGIHGGNVLEQISQNIFVAADANPELIVSKSFIDNFSMLGGCGATICLLIALLLFSRTESNRQLARSAFPFAIFNINELLVFGIPIVLNPILAAPFILVPVCSLLIAYGFTAAGILPVVETTVTWTTPILFSGYAATNSIWGTVVQIISISVGTLIYIPFLRISEQTLQEKEKYLLRKLSDEYKKVENEGIIEDFLEKKDAIGSMARQIASQLRADIHANRIPVFYQPQVDLNNSVIGAEALLRWQYTGEPLYPPLTVGLAQENHIYDRLTQCILKKVCQDILQMRPADHSPFLVSVNITAEQLNDPVFVRSVIAMAREAKVQHNLGLEVTEATSLVYMDNITKNIQALKEAGIPMAIDDFSMGKTSLKYLQSNSFGTVKLDGSLVMEATENPRSKKIICSITELGKSLNFKVVAEHVETQLIRDNLAAMGCDYFQGYFYNKAISMEEFKEQYKDFYAHTEYSITKKT